jgi:hypothetical protein
LTALLDTFADCLEECITRPDLFADIFLNDDDDKLLFQDDDGNPTTFWWRQREMCQSVVDYRTTVIYSGNAIGKDHWVGRLIWWWLYTHPGGLVIVTGPSQTLIGTVTWKEARRAIQNAPIPFKARISQGAKTSPQQIDLGNGWQALGYSTTNVERSSGQHAGDLLVIVEEASGVEDFAWDAVESLGYDRLVVIGNPTRAEGVFVDLIRQAERDRNDGIPPNLAVNAIQIPSTDSPHANLEKSDVGLASKTWIDSVGRRYGVKSLWYKSHVLAEIPLVSADILIPVGHIDLAFDADQLERVRQRRKNPGCPVHLTRRIAADLGEGVGRDSSAILIRDDWGVREVVWGAQLGLDEAATIIARMARQYSVPVSRISYDRLGIGRKFPLFLAKHGLQDAQPYFGSASPRDKTFRNLRTEAAWRLRSRLDPNQPGDIRSPHAAQDPFTFDELGCAPYRQRLRDEIEPLTYELTGKVTKLMDKEDWSEILGHSPDIADALIQSFAF